MPTRFNFNKKLRAFLRLSLGRRWINNTGAIIKTIVYRFFSVIVTFLISYIVTGDTQISLGVSALDFVGKTVLYYLFEINWENFKKRI